MSRTHGGMIPPPARELPRPPLDPDIDDALSTQPDIVSSLLPADISALRERAQRYTDEQLTLDGLFELSRHHLRGNEGNEIAMIVLRPRVTAPAPALYHVHGGGLVVGAASDGIPDLAVLAHRVGAAVVAVEYRLAPENRYPAAVEDVYAGLEWLMTQSQALGIDPDRVIINGVSAGGGLAAATALLARDRGGPRLLGQMLICPMLDDRNDSASGFQMSGHGAWDRTANATGWAAYLGEAAREDVSIYASPARATDLSSLPPAFIDVGSAETFRDEDIAYAQQIWSDGGDAELHVWPGGVHGFDSLAPTALLSVHAREARARWLERRLRQSRRTA